MLEKSLNVGRSVSMGSRTRPALSRRLGLSSGVVAASLPAALPPRFGSSRPGDGVKPGGRLPQRRHLGYDRHPAVHI